MTRSEGSRRGRRAAAIALAVIPLALVSIDGGGLASADGTARASRTATVGIVSFAYHPPTLTVGAGSRVVFSNNSGTAHTATRRGSFSTGRIKPGNSVAIRFDQKGTFRYHCTIHPFMKGKIVVD